MKVRSQTDLWAGLMFVAAGIFFTAFATSYQMGTAAKMGPGYFPFWLGLLQIILGVVVALEALQKSTPEDSVGHFDLKIIGLVLGGIVVFGLLLRPAGLILALIGLIGVSSLASHEFGWKGTVLNVIVMVALCMIVFVWALRLQFPVLPAFMAS